MQELCFAVDQLTNSIKKVTTAQEHPTSIVQVSSMEIKHIHKKDGWVFSWKQEFQKTDRSIHKLTLQGDEVIQGLVSFEPKPDQLFIELHLIESAPHNIGKYKVFAGVSGNIVAFCCKKSFELGFSGFVAFTAKSALIDHYIETLGAEIIYGHNRMAITTESSKKLVDLYFKDFINGRQEKTI